MTMTSNPPSNLISLTRHYDAPLAAVWAAWATPQALAQWWGPRGFTLTTHSRDLRAGGHWHYTMHGPDGRDYENTTQYLEVQPMARLVYDHGGHQDRPPLFRVTALFNESAGGTQLDLSMACATPEAATQMRGLIRQAGGDTTWDRLGEYVEKQRTGKECFLIARSFAAPIDRVYRMWTEPEQVAQWLPPTGASMRYLRAEPHVGGSSFYAMAFAGAAPMYGLIKYLAFDAPTRLVYTQQFSDAEERVIRPAFFKHWPLLMRTTVQLAVEAEHTTRVSLRWEPQEALPEDVAEFASQRASMTGGWTGSFDKLEALLV